MSQFKSAEEAAAAGKYVRRVRSFVKREAINRPSSRN